MADVSQNALKIAGQITSIVSDGTTPFAVASPTVVPNLTANPPIYDQSGNRIINGHFVAATCVLGTNCTMSLAGSAAYSANTAYEVQVRDVTTPADVPTVNKVSGVAMTLTGNGTDTLSFLLYPFGTGGGSQGIAGPYYPGTTALANWTAPNVAWTNPNNVELKDGVFATAALTVAAGVKSQYLRTTNYNGATIVPASATIDGILALIWVQQTNGASGGCNDGSVMLDKASTEVGNNKARSLVFWPASEGAFTYGRSTDLWGTTWTAAQINNAGFGLSIAASNNSADSTCQIDSVQLTVYYH